MIIPPVVDKKPNIIIGSAYKIKIRGSSRYTFVCGDDYHIARTNDTMTLVGIRQFKKSFEFTFITDNKLISYRAGDACSKDGYTCNFEEIV